MAEEKLKFPREYPTVPGLDEVEHTDFVAYKRAKDQQVRERAIDLEMVKILKERVMQCQRREEVNHPERCREHVEKYYAAFKKYRSEGWFKYH